MLRCPSKEGRLKSNRPDRHRPRFPLHTTDRGHSLSHDSHASSRRAPPGPRHLPLVPDCTYSHPHETAVAAVSMLPPAAFLTPDYLRALPHGAAGGAVTTQSAPICMARIASRASDLKPQRCSRQATSFVAIQQVNMVLIVFPLTIEIWNRSDFEKSKL